MKLKLCFSIHISIHRDNTVMDHGEKSAKPMNVSSLSFSDYAHEEIEQTRKRHQHSTASNYRTAVRSFIKFNKGEDIPLVDINSTLMDSYGEWLLQNNVSKDTLSCYMRSLRALYNKAVKKGYVQQCNPFSNVFTGISRTRKRAIEKEDIRKLQQAVLPPGSFMRLVRDVFLFCFYACGMPFIDVAFLKKSQLEGGFMTYNRHKTDQPVRIKLEPCMQEIINRYISNDREYVFPFLSSSDEDIAYKEYQQKMSYYNRTLKILGKKVGICRSLSSYVPRHTWATLAFRSAADLLVISQALGHTDTKTTRIYVKDIGSNKQDTVNKELLNGIAGILPLYKSLNSRK